MLRIQWNVAQGGTSIHLIPSSHDTFCESSVADGTNDLQRLHPNVETQSWTVVAGFAVTWQSSRWELSSTYQYDNPDTNMWCGRDMTFSKKCNMVTGNR